MTIRDLKKHIKEEVRRANNNDIMEELDFEIRINYDFTPIGDMYIYIELLDLETLCRTKVCTYVLSGDIDSIYWKCAHEVEALRKGIIATYKKLTSAHQKGR